VGERFKLVTHREKREMLVYVLPAGKNGARLHELKPGDATLPAPPDPFLSLRSPLEDFIAFVSAMGHVDRPILDKTGLGKSIYYFGLRWNGDEDIKIAVANSFGLKFESRKAAVDLVVIDYVEKPSPN
jgi:uncharacterized protein (TIGR03435 family)